jgi:hypothetical protein
MAPCSTRWVLKNGALETHISRCDKCCPDNPVDQARARLRHYLSYRGSARIDYRQIQFLNGLIICARIVAGDITVKLKKPNLKHIGLGEPGQTRH